MIGQLELIFAGQGAAQRKGSRVDPIIIDLCFLVIIQFGFPKFGNTLIQILKLKIKGSPIHKYTQTNHLIAAVDDHKRDAALVIRFQAIRAEQVFCVFFGFFSGLGIVQRGQYRAARCISVILVNQDIPGIFHAIGIRAGQHKAGRRTAQLQGKLRVFQGLLHIRRDNQRLIPAQGFRPCTACIIIITTTTTIGVNAIVICYALSVSMQKDAVIAVIVVNHVAGQRPLGSGHAQAEHFAINIDDLEGHALAVIRFVSLRAKQRLHNFLGSFVRRVAGAD